MKKVILDQSTEKTILLSKVEKDELIFVVDKKGIVMGMLIKEVNPDTNRLNWVLVLGGRVSGKYFPTREAIIQNLDGLNFDCYIELKI